MKKEENDECTVLVTSFYGFLYLNLLIHYLGRHILNGSSVFLNYHPSLFPKFELH
jgi:hypothetical protein